MLHGVILGRQRCLAGFRVHMYQRILLPAPGTLAVVAERIVPESVFFATIAQVMVDQMESMFSGLPVETAPATFAFTLYILILGIFPADFRQYLSAFPLETYAFDALRHTRVGEYLVDVVVAVRVEGAEV